MTPDEKERSIVTQVPATMHKRVRVKCAELGVTSSDVVRYLLQEWLEGRIQYRPTEDQQQQ
jgi:hypothetical protein